MIFPVWQLLAQESVSHLEFGIYRDNDGNWNLEFQDLEFLKKVYL